MKLTNNFQNFKTFAKTQPPLMIFILCLVAFGITTVVLAFIVREYDLPNPDIKLDWNVFLGHLAQLDMCLDIENSTHLKRKLGLWPIGIELVPLLANATKLTNNNTVVPSEPSVDELSLRELLPDITQLKPDDKNKRVNISINVLVPLKFGTELFNVPPNVRWLKGTITGRQMGFTGKISKENLDVSMFIPSYDKKYHIKRCINDPNCNTELNVCLVFSGSSELTPKSSEPQHCGKLESNRKPVNVAFRYSKKNYIRPENWCTGKTPLRMSYTSRPEYTVMLSSRDRSLGNLHLIHTSYFLFIIIITMLCYVLVRSHCRCVKNTEKVNV